VSVLRNRVIAKYADATEVSTTPAYSHPHGTAATPMLMPLALVDYGGAGTGSYQDMHAMATGDPNAVPMAVVAPGTFGKVVASGRP
jgi:hypothetical protein